MTPMTRIEVDEFLAAAAARMQAPGAATDGGAALRDRPGYGHRGAHRRRRGATSRFISIRSRLEAVRDGVVVDFAVRLPRSGNCASGPKNSWAPS